MHVQDWTPNIFFCNIDGIWDPPKLGIFGAQINEFKWELFIESTKTDVWFIFNFQEMHHPYFCLRSGNRNST